jgi:hypothetical protein
MKIKRMEICNCLNRMRKLILQYDSPKTAREKNNVFFYDKYNIILELPERVERGKRCNNKFCDRYGKKLDHCLKDVELKYILDKVAKAGIDKSRFIFFLLKIKRKP